MAKKKRPRDANQLARQIVDEATGRCPVEEDDDKDPAAVKRGKLGGLKGGKARAAKLSKSERSEIAKHAAKVRWAKTDRNAKD